MSLEQGHALNPKEQQRLEHITRRVWTDSTLGTLDFLMEEAAALMPKCVYTETVLHGDPSFSIMCGARSDDLVVWPWKNCSASLSTHLNDDETADVAVSGGAVPLAGLIRACEASIARSNVAPWRLSSDLRSKFAKAAKDALDRTCCCCANKAERISSCCTHLFCGSCKISAGHCKACGPVSEVQLPDPMPEESAETWMVRVLRDVSSKRMRMHETLARVLHVCLAAGPTHVVLATQLPTNVVLLETDEVRRLWTPRPACGSLKPIGLSAASLHFNE